MRKIFKKFIAPAMAIVGGLAMLSACNKNNNINYENENTKVFKEVLGLVEESRTNKKGYSVSFLQDFNYDEKKELEYEISNYKAHYTSQGSFMLSYEGKDVNIEKGLDGFIKNANGFMSGNQSEKHEISNEETTKDTKEVIRKETIKENKLFVTCSVKNVGNYKGKEVVQAFVRKPNDKIDNPAIELCNYQKTKELLPGEKEEITLIININELGNYDEKMASYILFSGEYIIKVGASSVDLINVCKLVVKEDIVLEKLNNKCGKPSFNDLKLERKEEDYSSLDEFVVENIFDTKEVIYKKDTYTDPLIEKLSVTDLALITLGHHETGFASIVGASCKSVVGGAGETVLSIKEINKSLTMADGPAGLRLKHTYGIDKKGVYDISMDPFMEKMVLFLPKLSRPFIMPPKNRHGEIHHQYTTAIPIGTALAQSFNDEFVKACGRLVAEEMKLFKVDLWLAPALNIHRNILCGRNFEYYSEDPYLSGKIAAAMTSGVEENKGLGVTIKHLACNNQELNRNNNNSHISERALREIYLKGFELCIKESNPKAIMTSYNLINGVHASESYELINDILRCEWGYDGLVMTDWIKTGRSFCKKSIYPAPYASKNILAGNDLTMPGANADYKDIIKAYNKGLIKKEDLIYSASRIYRSIKRQKEL